MTEELKPCPFCGGVAYIADSNEVLGFFVVKCLDCPARFSQHFESMKEAAEMWNRRVSE